MSERLRDVEPRRPFEDLTLTELIDKITQLGYSATDTDISTNRLFISLMSELELRDGTLSND